MANRVSTRNAQIFRFVVDTSINPAGAGAAITYTTSRSIEVTDCTSVQPVAGAAAYNQSLWKNAAGTNIALSAPGAVNTAVTRVTNLNQTNANLVAGNVIGLQSDQDAAVGMRVYVAFLPGVTATT